MPNQASIRNGRVGEGPQVPGPPPTTQLILLATVHGDPAGYGRAWRFFECWRPDVITVEISRFSVRYRTRAAESWQRRLAEALSSLPLEAAKHPVIARVAAQADLPFEYRAARDWGQAHGVPVKLLDAGGVARRHLPRYGSELFSPENLRILLESEAVGSLEDFVAGEFRRARWARAGKAPPRLFPHPSEAGLRERLWAKRLRRLVTGEQRVLHLGGWEHLLPWPDGGGLPHLLTDLQPVILLLDEVGYVGEGAVL